jgi:hypothetical protein
MRKLLILALLAAPLWAAPVAVQKKECHNTGATQSITCTFTSVVTAGNQIIVGTTGGGNWHTTGVSDDCADSYSTDKVQMYGGTIDPEAAIYRAVNVTGGTCTVTATSSGSSGTYGVVLIIEYSGLDNSAATPDVVDGQYGLATQTVLSGTLVTTNANDLLVMVGNSNTVSNPAGYAAGSGYTLQLSQEDGNCCQTGGLEDQAVSSTGSYSPSMTITGTAATYSGVSAAYKITMAAGTKVSHRVIQ